MKYSKKWKKWDMDKKHQLNVQFYTQQRPLQVTQKAFQKNENTASALNRGQEENICLLKVINFIEQIMQTLSNNREQ